MKAVLTIGGSDSSGSAGIQGDLKVWVTMNLHGCSAISALGVQNTRRVVRVEAVSGELIEAQIDAVANDFDCQVTKTGMMPNSEAVKVVARMIKRQALQPLVVDPTLVAKSGDRLADDETMVAMSRRLFPLAAVVTPNRFELARLLGGKTCATIGEGASGAKELARKFGCQAVIVKGFERPGPSGDSPAEMVDVFYDGSEIMELVGERRKSMNLLGAGGVLSAGIAGGLAQGLGIREAALQAKRMVTEAVRHATDLGSGRGPVNHSAWINVKK